MAYEDLKSYLITLQQEGLFHRVEGEVDPAWEISALWRMIFRADWEETRFGLCLQEHRGPPLPGQRAQEDGHSVRRSGPDTNFILWMRSACLEDCET